jgi:hypothetical protein
VRCNSAWSPEGKYARLLTRSWSTCRHWDPVVLWGRCYWWVVFPREMSSSHIHYTL